MPGRNYSEGTYRYGFNGKENDNEVKGDGNQQDYGMRVYDARLGKFLSVDPLTNIYPMLTPYQFSSNSPVANIDLDGAESRFYDIDLLRMKSGNIVLTRIIEDETKRVTPINLNFAGTLGHGNLYRIRMGDEDGGQAFLYTSYAFQPDPTFWEDSRFKGVPRQGGIMFTSKEGGGANWELNPTAYNVDIIQGDILFAALKTASSAGSGRELSKIISEISEGQKIVDKILGSLETVKILNESSDILKDSKNASLGYTLPNTLPSTKKNNSNSVEIVLPAQGIGKWTYYIHDRDGNHTESELITGKIDSIIFGSNGNPDTIFKRPYIKPDPPKIDIPKPSGSTKKQTR